jgi:demethylmenaquinone methyltransferase/2-methoxy-6-polyprenyl-1,4-benzoquinol methylase
MKVVPYKDSEKSKKAQVSEMFDGISKEYDRMNRLITFGVDLKWRKRLINAVLALKPQRILDVATGTGDLAIALAQQSDAQVTGLDLSSGMLDVGKNKVKHHGLQDRVDMVLGDSESLPFETNAFDAVTVAFGVRNFESLSKGIQEIHRVLKPGGTLAVLETSKPTNPIFKFGYWLHTGILMPLISKVLASDPKAYTYLVDSASSFPYNQALTSILLETGFSKASFHKQTLGAACIYYAQK